MRKITAVIISLVLAITASMPCLVFAAPATPKITIVGSMLKGDDTFFELSMKVTPNDVQFRTAGIVLQYDSSVIIPVAWDEAGTKVEMSAGGNWQNISAVPAVAPAEVSGKTALAYAESDTVNKPNTGYLYLSSEMPLPADVPEASPDPDASSADPVKELRTITVRFKYVADEFDSTAASKQKVENDFTNVVKLAPDDIAANSPAGQMAVYNADDTMTKEYYYTADVTNTAGLKLGTLMDSAPEFVLDKDAETANQGGGSDPANFAALVFFDWDEKTLLGSMVVDGSAPVEDINEYLNSFALTKLPSSNFNLSDMCDYDATTTADYDAAYNNTTYDTNYPLSSHDGYTFGKWIDFDSEDYTVYGDAVLTTNNNSTEKIEEPANPSYDKIKDGLVLKAAYLANSKMDPQSILNTPAKRNYSLSNNTEPNAGYFARYDKDNYAVRVNLSRISPTAVDANSKSLPVQRPRKTAVKAIIKQADGTNLSVLVNVDNVDEQIAEVSAPASAQSVTFLVTDIGGIDNWVAGANRSVTDFTVSSADYIKYGTVNYLNEFAASNSTATPPVQTVYSAAGLDVSVIAGFTGSSFNMNARRAVIANIQAAQNQKAAALGDNMKYLSHGEMQYAIINGSYQASSGS